VCRGRPCPVNPDAGKRPALTEVEERAGGKRFLGTYYAGRPMQMQQAGFTTQRQQRRAGAPRLPPSFTPVRPFPRARVKSVNGWACTRCSLAVTTISDRCRTCSVTNQHREGRHECGDTSSCEQAGNANKLLVFFTATSTFHTAA
jgi:hypothetical protein